MNNADHPVGLIAGMDNHAYHSAPGVSSTQIKKMAVPLEYWDAYINPDRDPSKQTPAMMIGSAVHTAVLEPHLLQAEYDVMPEGLDRRTKEGKATYAALEASGKTILSADDYKMVTSVQRAVLADPLASGLLADAECEQSFFWRDHDGILRKCRTDAITANGEFVVDLKTTDDVSKAGFGRTIANYGYHISAAWYLDVLQGLYGNDAPQGFAFVAVQKTRPYDVAVHYLNDRQIQLGRMIYRKHLASLIECMASGVWPGAANGEFIEAELPVWEMRKLELLEGEDLL